MKKLTADEREWEAEMLEKATMTPDYWFQSPVHQPERIVLWARRVRFHLRNWFTPK